MKRYLVFSGSNTYPLGGMLDFVQSFSSLEKAEIKLKSEYIRNGADWGYIYDRIEQRRVS